jgi:hypothetical protein
VKAHIFVDECKVRGLLLAAAVIPPSDLALLRKLLGGLRLPGQRRIHFSAESDARRKVILRALVDAGLEARIYDATSIKDIQLARDTAVARLVDDAAELGVELLVLERDDESVAADRKTILARRKLTGYSICRGLFISEPTRTACYRCPMRWRGLGARAGTGATA